MPEPPRVAAVQAADFSRPSPGTRDDLFASPEPTTVGEPALMEDLVARSRPSTAGAGFEIWNGSDAKGLTDTFTCVIQ